jgi:hypothetical protein
LVRRRIEENKEKNRPSPQIGWGLICRGKSLK